METTAFKLVLSQQNIPSVPDTGLLTRIGLGGSLDGRGLGIIILAFVSITLLTIALVAFILRKKSHRGFGLAKKRTSTIFRSFMGISLAGVLCCAGTAIYLGYGGANASTGTVNFRTSSAVTVEGEIDPDEVNIFCGSDIVTLNQATPAGYTLSMGVQGGKLVLQSNEVEAEFVPMEDELLPGTWGYLALPYGAGFEGQIADHLTGIPTTQTGIRSVASATEVGDRTVVTICAAADANTELGAYLANIQYSVAVNTVNYTLNYDANGGTFTTAIAAQESGATTDNSYTFTITDIEPTAPAGTALNFYGWSLTGDSLSDVYTAGETITVTDLETTLKAVWGYERHTITYDKNTTDEVTNYYQTQYCIVTEENTDSCTARISSRIPARHGYTLLGWSKIAYTPAEGDTLDTARGKIDYIPGDSITLEDDLTLHAIWWEVSTNDFQMELRWGAAPRDLDSHLVAVRNSDGQRLFEVYYSHKIENIENGTITLSANLDIDDTSSYGPETVTLNLLPQTAYEDYTFYYFIKNFSGESEGNLLKESSAEITLIRAGGLTTEYSVANAQGASAGYWNVFAIKNGEIVERNTLTSTPELNY